MLIAGLSGMGLLPEILLCASPSSIPVACAILPASAAVDQYSPCSGSSSDIAAKVLSCEL